MRTRISGYFVFFLMALLSVGCGDMPANNAANKPANAQNSVANSTNNTASNRTSNANTRPQFYAFKLKDSVTANIGVTLDAWCQLANSAKESCEDFDDSFTFQHIWTATGRDPGEYQTSGIKSLLAKINANDFFANCAKNHPLGLAPSMFVVHGPLEKVEQLHKHLYNCDPLHN